MFKKQNFSHMVKHIKEVSTIKKQNLIAFVLIFLSIWFVLSIFPVQNTPMRGETVLPLPEKERTITPKEWNQTWNSHYVTETQHNLVRLSLNQSHENVEGVINVFHSALSSVQETTIEQEDKWFITGKRSSNDTYNVILYSRQGRKVNALLKSSESTQLLVLEQPLSNPQTVRFTSLSLSEINKKIKTYKEIKHDYETIQTQKATIQDIKKTAKKKNDRDYKKVKQSKISFNVFINEEHAYATKLVQTINRNEENLKKEIMDLQRESFQVSYMVNQKTTYNDVVADNLYKEFEVKAMQYEMNVEQNDAWISVLKKRSAWLKKIEELPQITQSDKQQLAVVQQKYNVLKKAYKKTSKSYMYALYEIGKPIVDKIEEKPIN